MTPHKARNVCYILLAAMVLLAMMGAAWQSYIPLMLSGCCLVATCVLMLLFWRCPHCDRSLGKLGNLKYCPYCGEMLDK